MEIKILGTGCAKCKRLESQTRQAITELGWEAEIEKVESIEKIASYSVLSTPALVCNNKILFSGRVPSVEEIKTLLSQAKETLCFKNPL